MAQNNDLAEAIRKAREMAAKMTPGIVAAAAAQQQANGNGDMNSRKRPHDEGGTGDDGPQVKKLSMEDPQAVAQAAIAKFVEKVGAQLGLPHMMTVEIKIPNRMVGLVIGRGGEMITRLQAESGARIQVAPDGSEVSGERQVTICGTQDTIDKSRALIGKVVEDAGGQLTNIPLGSALGGMSGGMSGMSGMAGMAGMMGGEEVAELMIPANKVGLIIGKGGEMIKALQEKAGCKMQMIQDGPYSNAPEKPLRMSGAPDNCKKARELVLQLMEQKELEFGSQARGLLGSETSMAGSVVGVPHTIEIQVLKQMVGYVIGRGGEHINNIQSNCGVRLQFQNDVPGTDYRIATISGTPEGCQRARKWVDDLVAERQNQGFRPRLELPNPTGPGVQTIQFGVPGNKCGLIIGKGGDTIRQIQVQSGAHVELHRGTQPNPDEKLFNVRGNSQQIQLAQQLIRQKYENVPGAGGSPQYGPGSPYQGAQVFGAPQGAMYGGPGGAPAAAPWAGQYPSQGQQQTDPNHQAAWAAYYQQLYAAQAAQAQAASAQQQGAQPPAGGQQPQPQQQMAGGGATPSQEQIQSQWAEYYRQMGYYYQQAGQPGQQQGQQPPHAAPGGPENK